MLITVFTPTYNRAHLLGRLYESLCAQRFTDFEWLIVDDGSTDGTASLVQGFIAERRIDIKYLSQRNGGKHRAINHGVGQAKGELFFIVDSDDYLPADSLQSIATEYAKCDSSMGGVAGLDATDGGKVIGSGLAQEFIECNSMEIRFKHHVTGDLAEVFKTSVMREFPFPEIDGEKFCPEALVWNRIALKYNLRYFNKVIYIAEYQDGGLTDNIVRVRRQSPVTSTTYYAELLLSSIPWGQKLKAAINYWRFRLCCKKFSKVPQLPLAWNAVWPLGWLMHLRDQHAS
mgnify:CR=1 FL=1